MRDVLRTGRRETIRQAAYHLADSGSYTDWQSIEGCLCVRYGLIEARRLLTDRTIRAELNRRCAAATKKDRPAGNTG
ncbi:hypothetical protein G3A43_42500 [Paraburkholderia aspalathi]|nr:hypothetical protein [Paraburkholderia aspalathi]